MKEFTPYRDFLHQYEFQSWHADFGPPATIYCVFLGISESICMPSCVYYLYHIHACFYMQLGGVFEEKELMKSGYL